ncbi:MAG: hypothetical protein QOG03_337, partial [Actinomycetota bacterium]|nr:hypothetical protein [Actinomycetota bacterium]
MNRLTAILLAAALVAGAVFARGKINTHKTESSAVLRLTCSTELEATCHALHDRDHRIVVTVEAAGVTMDRAAPLGSGADLGFDGWLTVGPWPIMAVMSVSGSPLSPEGLLRGAPLGLAVRADRATLLTKQCGGQVTWVCVRDALAKGRWEALPGGTGLSGDIRFGLPDPGSEALGLLTLDAAAEAHQPDLSSTDLTTDEFLQW